MVLIAEKIPREQLEAEARERYRRETGRDPAARRQAPDPVNQQAAESLFEAIPLLWKGVEYRVRPISYREGLRLQRMAMRFEELQSGAADTSDVDAHEALLDGMLGLFVSLLDPSPTINPFEDATPLEVGALAGFFFTCQRIQNQPDQLARIHLSPSIT